MLNQKPRNLTEKDRENFAKFMRNREPAHILRKIAAAFNWASDEVERGVHITNENIALHNALKRHNLKNYSINGGYITYRQARIVYEMVVEKKYGDLVREAETANRPEGVFPKMFNQSAEDYLNEYSQRMVG